MYHFSQSVTMKLWLLWLFCILKILQKNQVTLIISQEK